VSARRGATSLSGILAIDKPAGMTSHDVVNRVRRVTGERRVGHAGTLDPMATGLLVVLVGPATRLASHLTAAEKVYEARILFGTETDTDDADGTVTRTAEVPDEACDPFFAAGTVERLVGTHEQVPPAFSAIKQGGVTAHRAARGGVALALEPRTIQVTAARLLGVDCAEQCAWDVELSVSKGTYIRALVRDLGRALDSAAHLGALRRTRSGALSLENASSLEAIEAATDVATLFADPLAALDMRVLDVSDAEAARVATGASLPGEAEGDVAIAHAGVLLAIYAGDGSVLKPLAVIPGGVAGGAR
jgi:tRNA pseudouridine55 synthase